jgi:phospholipid/cholesterol/gamma-HCH transport system substrate-binding protein
MRLEYSTTEKMVGGFILLTLFISLFTVAMVGRGKNWFRKQVGYYTIFKEGYNLSAGSRVKLFGTDVGQVTGVSLTEDNKVRVAFRILADYASRMRTDSLAIVESPTFIGSEYVALSPGSKSAPALAPGGQIPSKEKKSLSDYFEEYEVDKMVKRLSGILEDLARISAELGDRNGPLMGTLQNVKQLTGTMEQGRGSLGRLIRRDELYLKIMEELDALSKILASVRETADQSVTIGSHVARLSERLATASEHAPEMALQFQEIVNRMVRVSLLLEKSMTEVPEISQQAREGMREVNRILDSIQKNFLIRPNLPPPRRPATHGLEPRGE